MLAEEFEKQYTCLGDDTEKYITFSIPIEKKATRIYKKQKKSQKPYHTYNLLIAQDLWHARYQIWLIFLKKFIKLNVNTDTGIKNVKLAKLNTKTATTFLNSETLKVI